MSFWQDHRAKKKLAKLRSEVALCRHNDDDILGGDAKEKLDALLLDMKTLPAAESAERYGEFEGRFRKAVPPYRYQTIRGLLDLLLVVGAVAFGIRALFLQPFRIPTSSMQPTLYGIHYIDAEHAVNPLLGKLPEPLEWLLFSTRRADATVKTGGELDVNSVFATGNFFADSTAFTIGGTRYKLPGDPRKVIEYTGLRPGREYRPGETLAKGWLSMGDHLFVERWSIYMTPLKRGDVMVFTTEGLTAEGRRLSDLSGFFYIKRLAGLPGDTLKIADDVLMIKPAGETEFRPVREIAPAFDKVYSGNGGYQGHLGGMGKLVASPLQEYVVPEDHYFMLGDNSRFSLDSRFFGAVPRRNLVGRAWVVFWPFSRRWGFVDRAAPLEVPTGRPSAETFPVMYYQ